MIMIDQLRSRVCPAKVGFNAVAAATGQLAATTRLFQQVTDGILFREGAQQRQEQDEGDEDDDTPGLNA